MAEVIIEAGGIFRKGDDESFTVHDVLPAGVYKVGIAKTGFYLYGAKEFSDITKMYGNVEKRVERIMTTFKSRENTTGVLLSGDKGSGKTMLAKKIAHDAVNKGYPVILVSPDILEFITPFVEFISSFDFPMVVILDEFEKMFEKNEDQNGLLTMFDGLYTTKRLFVLTVNNLAKVNDFFKSRPGRIFYHFTYQGLDQDVLKEYCVHNEVDNEFLSELMVYHQLNDDLTFDSLKAIVEEYKRYNLGFEETIDGMNISLYRTNEKYKMWTVKTVIPKYDMVVENHSKFKGSIDYIHIHNDVDKIKFKPRTKKEITEWLENNNMVYFYTTKKQFVEKNSEGLIFKIADVDVADAYISISEYDYSSDYGNMNGDTSDYLMD